MQNFVELYKELADKLTLNVPNLRWVDLWNSQVYHMEEEHPFPAPAIFLAFRSNSMQDQGNKVQKVTMQVDVFIYYETFLDTFRGAYNQSDALAFLNMMDHVNQLLHGSSGQSYSSMRRVSYSPIDTGGAGNLWNIVYNCELIDYSAMREFGEGGFKDLEVQKFDIP
ncbi:hypothetical protein ABE545_10735 [Sphingobacterium faecium]|jgi:hypothetical protein|uniref:hypothetical protein n=1 Tax=Sphingobacterium faecium TaxID=34087 RepID=UPI00320839D1